MIWAEIDQDGCVANLLIAERSDRIPPKTGVIFVEAHANVCLGTMYDADTGEFVGVSPPDQPAVETSPDSQGEEVPANTEPCIPKQVSPIEFKLLWTPEERVAIKAMRASDPVVDDYLEIIDDPRLTLVDFGLANTQQAVDYILIKLVAAGVVTEEDQPLRREAIFSGQFK